ncbi:MAG: MCE family protein [Nocardioides sp.]|uniref:MCE family protein n=1 Tax=Nocardioides sp. TaxID=35761 RepID=UPI00326457CB
MMRLVTLLLALLVLATGCKFDGAEDLPLPGGPHTVAEEDGFQITADFSDVLNVVPRTPVMVDDVPVGQVLEVERAGWHAEVTMRVRKDVVLPGSVIAEVRQTSLLGEKYIALVEPDQGVVPAADTRKLSDGDHLPLAQTGRNPEVEEVLGALSFLLSGGGVAQIKTISQELNAMMNGRSDELRDVLSQVETLMTALNGQKGDLIAAFDSVNELSKTLVDEKQVIADALDSMGPALAVLNEQHDALVRMLTELDELGVVGTRVINATKDNLVAQLRHLEPVLRKLADADDNLVPGLVSLASYPFPLEAADVIKGDYANVAFLMQIKLTPVSEGGLIPSTLDDVQQLCLTTPLAPVCTQTDTALDQLCAGAPGLPLCRPATLARVPAVVRSVR